MMLFVEVSFPLVRPFFYRNPNMVRFGVLCLAVGWSRRSLKEFHDAAASGKTKWVLK